MNIKIVDSWLREFLETKATPSLIGRELSLRSVSVERIEKVGEDSVYDIEVTTNRPDLMSVWGIAKEAVVDLSSEGVQAIFKPLKTPSPKEGEISFPIEIKADPKLVNRIKAVVLEVEIGDSPKEMSKRLELSGIRSLNNLVDVTNYVMRETGQPAHVFDFDLLNTKKMIIRESKAGEEITTLDGKKYRLYGGDIVADDGRGNIIDLLGVMGTANSVVQSETKRILFFLDNINPVNVRKTSMSLGIRTEAAIINEKGVDPEILENAFNRGIELYGKIAHGKVITKIYDYYPNKAAGKTIEVPFKKINKVIGVEIKPQESKKILEGLGFGVSLVSNFLEVKVPSIRPDVKIDEDIIEEIARIYGYHKLPSVVPTFLTERSVHYYNKFYIEERVKNAFKYWGFTEVYTYSLVSEDLFEGSVENAVKLKNPLTEDMVYLRNTLAPSLIKVVSENKGREEIKIFEIANIYLKKSKDLPSEILTLAGLIKNPRASFLEVKGLIEQLFTDLGIKNYKFRQRPAGPGADVFIKDKKIGYIEILNQQIVDFELNFEETRGNADFSKKYKPLIKFPSVTEDVTFVLPEGINTEDIINEISLQSFLITDVSLKDTFENAKTFHIVYQAEDRTLSNKEVSEIREEVIRTVTSKFKAQVK